MNELQLKILSPLIGDSIPIPTYSTKGSAGLDLRACMEIPLTLRPGKTELINTGLSIYIENPEYAALILPRSGLGHKHGIVLGNLVGLIDSDYQGELIVHLKNHSNAEYLIQNGDRIAQLVIMPVFQAQFTIVDDWSVRTKRGHGGFGSTGND